MSEAETAVTEEDAYAIAYALGHPFPAPHGASIVNVAIIDSEVEGGAVFERVYVSEEDAYIELARWVINQEMEGDPLPWEYDAAFMQANSDEDDWKTLARAWYGSKTPAEIVQRYFKDGGFTGGEILYMAPSVITKPNPWKGGAEADW